MQLRFAHKYTRNASLLGTANGCRFLQIEEMAVRSTASELGRLSEMEFLNMEITFQDDRETLHAGSKHLTKLEKQETLKTLAAEGWLVDCGSRQYCVGVRFYIVEVF